MQPIASWRSFSSSVINTPWTVPWSTTRITAAAPMNVGLKSLTCTNCGKLGHVSRACPLPHKTDLKTMFEEHRCCICGLHGHISKHCPTEGGDPSLSPKFEMPTPKKVLWANKVCMTCGERGHIFQACPKEKFHLSGYVTMKRIDKRLAGARLQKSIPKQLQSPKQFPKVTDRLKYTEARGLLGKVVRTTHSKTVSVLVERHTWHKWLGIREYKYTKLFVHDEDESCICGDLVRVVPCRPVSKLKHHIVKEVVMGFNQDHEIHAERALKRKEHYAGIDEKALERLNVRAAQFEKQEEDRATRSSKGEKPAAAAADGITTDDGEDTVVPPGFKDEAHYRQVMLETKAYMEKAAKQDQEDYAAWKKTMAAEDAKVHQIQDAEDDAFYEWAQVVDDLISRRKGGHSTPVDSKKDGQEDK